MGSDFGHFRTVTFDTILYGALRGRALATLTSALVQEVDLEVRCLGTGDALPGQNI